MRILVAPDKFKDCMSAAEAADAIRAGILRAMPGAVVDICPVADGGEGTVDALVNATGGRFEIRRVTGPLAEMKVEARFGILGDGKTAVIEMASASGLALLAAEDRDPMRTTTFGTGELLMAAAGLGVSRIILGIGGSATVDGGVGCAQACGLPVILEGGEPVSATEPLVGADVARVVLIKHGRGSAIERIPIIVATDVTNPLCGPNGAAAIFGPQKGATPQQAMELDAALLQLAWRNDKMKTAEMPGAGAAGGLGFGMAAFFGATLRSGIEIVLEAVDFAARLKGADLCITGEGKLDEQSLSGKATVGVARACKAAGVPCIVLAGAVHRERDFQKTGGFGEQGITAALSICNGPMNLEDAMAKGRELLEDAAEGVGRIIASQMRV